MVRLSILPVFAISSLLTTPGSFRLFPVHLQLHPVKSVKIQVFAKHEVSDKHA